MDSQKNKLLAERLQKFIDALELVLDGDWDFTYHSFSDNDLISLRGTFLNPYPGIHFTGGKGDNWANRSYFISAYRELKAFAISEGLYGEVSE